MCLNIESGSTIPYSIFACLTVALNRPDVLVRQRVRAGTPYSSFDSEGKKFALVTRNVTLIPL